MNDESLYTILGTTRSELDADPTLLKKVYRTAAQAAHPDQGGSDSAMQAVNLAYVVLSDPEKRRVYDETGSSQIANGYRADIEKTFAVMFIEHLNRSMAEVENGTPYTRAIRISMTASDPLISLRSMVDQNLQTLKGQIKEIKEQIRKLERAATKLKFKGKATEKNVLGLAIRGAVLEAESRKLSAERQISFLSDIRVEADKYECFLADPPPAGGAANKRPSSRPQIVFARAMPETSEPIVEGRGIGDPEVWHE